LPWWRIEGAIAAGELLPVAARAGLDYGAESRLGGLVRVADGEDSIDGDSIKSSL
jgi:hypothetical protein